MSANETIPHDITDDGFLNNRLKILQPRKGYRAGLDAVMVAAAVPALPGDKIFEAGIGTGVAALCLASRVPDIQVTGVETNPDYVGLAKANAERNGFEKTISIVTGNMTELPDMIATGQISNGFDHAFANPPYREKGRSRAPKDPGRANAHVSDMDTIAAWTEQMVALVKEGGTVTLILPPEIEEAFRSLPIVGSHQLTILPLVARDGAPAIRIVHQLVKGASPNVKTAAGLILHENDGRHTSAADHILRAGGALAIS
jgi:tRNA1(Val) A37 N6-methylase TrmN6